MRVALACFPRSPGEVRLELDLERGKVRFAFYVPALGHAPHCESHVGLDVREINAAIAALEEAKRQIVEARMAAT